MQHSLIYFPDYAHANPYQAMLYASIDGAFSARPGTISSALEALGRADWAQRTIFHLHWEDAIYRHLPGSDTALEECRRFLDDAEQFIDDGGLFVWTIHNRAPHDGRYLDVHRQLCAKLAVLAQQIHVHSYTAGAELVRDRHLDRSKLVVIPHGNYAPIYARRKTAEPAAKNGRRFLLFGRLGRYKGSAELVRAFVALPDQQAELVIAGKQIDPIDLSGLPPSVAARITTQNRFLDQAEIPDLVASADLRGRALPCEPHLGNASAGDVARQAGDRAAPADAGRADHRRRERIAVRPAGTGQPHRGSGARMRLGCIGAAPPERGRVRYRDALRLADRRQSVVRSAASAGDPAARPARRRRGAVGA